MEQDLRQRARAGGEVLALELLGAARLAPRTLRVLERALGRRVATGASSSKGDSGSIVLSTGDVPRGNTGAAFVTSGVSTSAGSSGDVLLRSGDTSVGNVGYVSIATGRAFLGAAGAIEAAITIMALKHQTAPPTINLDNAGDGCDLDYVPHTARDLPMTAALSNSFGFGGTNGSLIFKQVS